jgi:cobalt/nickel transport system permease protein
MTHLWHDAYRHHRIPAHHLDPRSKLAVALVTVAFILLSPRWSRLQVAGFSVLLGAAAIGAGISLKRLVGRLTVLLPFVLVMGVSLLNAPLALSHYVHIITDSLLCVATMALLALTTPFPDLLAAFRQWRLPRLLVLLLAFLYRYSVVVYEEVQQVERGWRARYFGRRWVLQWQRLGHVVAALFVRSFERAERVYGAMQSRGFSGQASLGRVLHYGVWDAVFVLSSMALLGVIRWGL